MCALALQKDQLLENAEVQVAVRGAQAKLGLASDSGTSVRGSALNLAVSGAAVSRVRCERAFFVFVALPTWLSSLMFCAA